MKCIICGKEIKGYGNNPDPLTDEKGELFDIAARCCDSCNDCYVIPYRLAKLTNNERDITLIQNQVNRLRGVDIPKKVKRIIAIVERPDGTTYEQEIENINDDIQISMERAQNTFFGSRYGWKTVDGKRVRYLRNDIYLIVSAYFTEGASK